MKGPEMADLLRTLGFDDISSHMAVLDDPSQMVIIARLEAQGLSRQPVGESSDPSKPRKKKLTDAKKSLPTPVGSKGSLRKKLPGSATADADDVTPDDEAATLTEPAPAIEDASEIVEETEVAETTEEADVEKEPEPPAPETDKSAEELPAEELPAEDVAAEGVAAEGDAAEGDAAEGDAPEGGPSKTKADEGSPDRPVKKLLVPQAKATVLGKIELPQETIRDATRRSAPGAQGDTAASDRKLRRAALQSTQSRTAARTPGQRRGPGFGPGGRGRGRPGGHRRRSSTSTSISPTVDPDKVVEIQPPISVKGLSAALGIPVSNLIATLTFKLGVKGKTINAFISPEEVELVAIEVGRNIKIVEHKEAEEELIEQLVERASEESDYHRAPVLTFMGHVDHGKTTLLDKLRSSDVVQGEAGGITQHIGAYRITTKNDQNLVVLDTPGHAAFTSMRARGASVTDIIILVVAADDGVMPQTEEAINHAKESSVPIIVAINKCDTEGANPMQVRQQLAVKGLQSEEWGGETQTADVSAITGEGMDGLIEKVFLEAELLELTAKPDAPGQGIVIESKQSPEQGVVVNVLITDGTLRLRDNLLCGNNLARVRGMMNDRGEQITEAGPSTPVTLIGMDTLPEPGDKLFAVTDTRKARQVVDDRQRHARDVSLAERSSVTLENLGEALAAKEVGELKLILKADVTGSLEPIKQSLDRLATDEVRVNIIHSALGGINETDVSLAEASSAVIVGFNAVPDPAAREAAKRAGVEIRFYDVIYTLIDEIRLSLEGLLKPDEIESVIGHAEIRAIFKSSKFGNIAGCQISDGVAKRNAQARLNRDGSSIWKGKLSSLRRVADDVREVKAGIECGMTLDGFTDIKVGDEIEFFEIQLVKRTL